MSALRSPANRGEASGTGQQLFASSAAMDRIPQKARRMRILHTIDSNGIYGAETVLLNLAVEQQRRGHTPIILSIGNTGSGEKPIETEAGSRGLQCIPCRMRDGLNLAGVRRILQLAEQQQIDVIHSHGYKSNILLAAMPKALRKRPVVATLHGWTAKKTLSKLGLYRFIDQRLLHRLDAVVVVNEQLKTSAAMRSLDPRKVHVIPNGIDIDPSSANHPPPDDALARQIQALKSSCDFVVGAVGRLSPEKNFGALVEAMRQLAAANRRIGAVILGAGPEAALLQRLIATSGLADRTLLGGYVRDARRYLGLFDLLVIPSLTEGLPMILLEGMSLNLPIIATTVGDIPATLGNLGTLVQPGNTAELAGAILAMTSDLPQYKRKASAALDRVLGRHSSTTVTDCYDKVYGSVLQYRAG